ncbi:hypothetical protein [Massilia psychrophila]|uniref:Uncharacterized protein n=1 Tax=Massilia psychrophila TaxID=1603353 RepID=A0A2G8SXA5_9BURK|nr:hypothetical protein [Massilia psychrophila]PIL38333.1 hypothetical protein CR103_18640 [Massilia psychrophila]GGE83734.1 hypothetical protein GCM10008020_30760 [Massilia psychrophila]
MEVATEEVFAKIVVAGQKPHIIYSLGMKRFSCVFCIYADGKSLTRTAQLITTQPWLVNDPNVYRNYASLKKSARQVMMMSSRTHGRRTLEQITGIAA